MGGKPKPPKFRTSLDLDDARDIYNGLAKGWINNEATQDWLDRLSEWLKEHDGENQ